MKGLIKRFFAVNVSLAYLGMLTGFGMLAFTLFFFYLLLNDINLPLLLHVLLTYLMLILGPGALILASAFYLKMRKRLV